MKTAIIALFAFSMTLTFAYAGPCDSVEVRLSQYLLQNGIKCVEYDIIQESNPGYLSPAVEVYIVLSGQPKGKLLFTLGASQSIDLVGGEAQPLNPELQAGFKHKSDRSELHNVGFIYGARFIEIPRGVIRTVSVGILNK